MKLRALPVERGCARSVARKAVANAIATAATLRSSETSGRGGAAYITATPAQDRD